MKHLFLIAGVCGTMLLGGCSSISQLHSQYNKNKAQNEFNRSVSDSQFMVLEAEALLMKGRANEAKILLDNAFQRFKDHVSLHETYQLYYQRTGNDRLAALAQKRANDMKERSSALNKKGRVAMVDYEAFEVAEDLFALSLTYWAENTGTLINMATLAYVTHNVSMGLASIDHLNRLGHTSAEASMLSYLIHDMAGNNDMAQIARIEMATLYKETDQYRLISNADYRG